MTSDDADIVENVEKGFWYENTVLVNSEICSIHV